MPRHSPVLDFSGPLADHHLLGDMPARLAPRPSAWHPQGASGPQTRHQFTLERTATLDEQRLIDRLVRDPHAFIIREIQREAIGDLLGAPGRGPAPILTARLVAALPLSRWWTFHDCSVDGSHHTRKTV